MEIENMDKQTALTRTRYNRIAPIYDLTEWFAERYMFKRMREQLWSRVTDGRVLEIGVGTGKNISYYPQNAVVTAVDLSDRMLDRARDKAHSLRVDVDLRHMDVQHLEFKEHTFDTAVASFVFCSVPDPVQGLRELGQVVRPGGDIWLLEHVRVDKPIVGTLMDLLNPIIVRISGANINRRTVENVTRAGLELLSVENLKGELVRLIHARP